MFIIFGLKSIIKQLLDLVFGILFLKCIIKQLLDSVFVICKIINVKAISQKPHAVISLSPLQTSKFFRTSFFMTSLLIFAKCTCVCTTIFYDKFFFDMFN